MTPGSLVDKDVQDLDVDIVGFNDGDEIIIASKYNKTIDGLKQNEGSQNNDDYDKAKRTNSRRRDRMNKPPALALMQKRMDIDALEDDRNIADGQLNTGYN